MPSIETAIHYCFAAGVVAMVAMCVVLGIQVLTLGTQENQARNKERVRSATAPDTSSHEAYYVGFFHPYPNSGGGGERVLWTMIKAIQERYPYIVSVIYSGDNIDRDALVANARARFGVDIRTETVFVVEVTRRWWIEHKFRRLTLLMQSVGSVWLACQAVHRFCPDVFVDTVGFAFTYPLLRLLTARIPVVSYTHYPTISSDMRRAVSSREAGVNNDATVARSATMTALKSAYYAGFGYLYAVAGSFASTVMTNSTWTHNHVVRLFGNPAMTRVVYPPCDTAALLALPVTAGQRLPFVVSLAQFRPEKNHMLQIEAFAQLLATHPELVAPSDDDEDSLPQLSAEALLQLAEEREKFSSSPKSASDTNRNRLPAYPVLIMLGGARNIEDEARAEELRQAAQRLGVARQVRVVVNARWPQVLRWLRHAKVGLHTMRDEHFGISIVEMMAAGLLTVAHDSAGPKLDIVVPAIRCTTTTDDGSSVPAMPSVAQAEAFLAMREDKNKEKGPSFPVGMLATTADEFARQLAAVLAVDGVVARAICQAARDAVAAKFSEHAFFAAFYRRFGPVVRWLDIQRTDE
ncbi:asparagine-linked glycosylation protein [Coemansia sp. RSA 1200]|nr:asparagine-linked glycosylation protein [Coemansia sp. RSA 1200]